jgi:PIN domain nuclease of toxin-antitoxin system
LPKGAINDRDAVLGVRAKLRQHHHEHFGRLLVAQMIVEKMSIVSADIAFDHCGIGRKR